MNPLKKLFSWYFSKRTLPYWCVLVFDCLVVLTSGLVVYTLNHGATSTALVFYPLIGTLCFYLIFYVIGFRLMRTYQGVIRYSSFVDIYKVGVAMVIGLALIALLRELTIIDDHFVFIRYKDHLFSAMLATGIMCGVRVIVKLVFDGTFIGEDVRRVFIYGVKEGGVGLAKLIKVEVPKRFVLKGFVADAEDGMFGKRLMGMRIYKNDEKLSSYMEKTGVRTLLVSPLKQDAFVKNTEMVNRLVEAGVKIYITNKAESWNGGNDMSETQLREVNVEDLLPRDEIQVDLNAVEGLLKDKSILITGSAGSIGSEMVRQIAKFAPRKLILIDSAETPQHDIRLMMKKNFPDIEAETIVTTICRQSRMEEIFKQHKPDYVFHAAAYKHVPMMEDNPCESIQNNVGGTKILADLAVKYGVKKFVMISTDKAVNPTNVMGCSKRICEIYVQSLDKAVKEGRVEGVTQFVTTRFGNVLGSNGSVIPLFTEQIKNGGPVTVTHPDIIRYFMLIPEACKLVLEAGTMGHGGEIFVFDMGKPVRIADLAKRMISLSGAKHVEIKYTGLRDGEKLYEEVLNDEEITKPTFNSKIKIATVREYDYGVVERAISNLIALSYGYDHMATVAMMKEMVPEYRSKNSIYEQLDKEEGETES